MGTDNDRKATKNVTYLSCFKAVGAVLTAVTESNNTRDAAGFTETPWLDCVIFSTDQAHTYKIKTVK